MERSVHSLLSELVEVSLENNRKNGLMKGRCVALERDVCENQETFEICSGKKHPFTRDSSRKRN